MTDTPTTHAVPTKGAYTFTATCVGNVVWLRDGDLFYLWDPDRKVTQQEQTVLELAGRRIKRLSSCDVSDAGGWDDDEWFIFFVSDCFDPIVHAIKAKSFESAYEDFIDAEGERGHYLITDEEMPDHLNERGEYEGDYTSNGKPIVTESFMGHEVDFYALENR